MSLNLVLFIAVVVLVVGWFAAGTHTNVRKGEDALRWLQRGLPLIGEKTTLRWLGSSVVELKITQAKPPFRETEVLVVLEPRDVALLWWIARLRGRRDLFIFRGTLNKHPRMEIVAHDPNAWTLAVAERHDGWVPVAAPAPLVASMPQQQRPALDLLAAAALDGCPLVRFTLRATEPHLEVQWRLNQVRKHEPREVFEAMRAVTQKL